ncbi:MAG TPA: Sir2 family NAD-dependent protein deacetylase [Kofleriaceae bacterium]|nr:Sir2 family NAD-dependent protein deacetylase [Kofleriaceae bacterium]
MERDEQRERERIDAIGTLLTQVRSALFITGPGLSIESGLPHYRGIPGLLRRTAQDARMIESALSVDTLHKKPKLTWRTLLEIDRRVCDAQPSRGHEVLVGLERRLQRATIMTVNVDRLHQRAGSRSVIEMHGALHDLRCARCEISTRHDRYAGLPLPPLCAACGSVLRPDMALFGEPLPPDAFTRLQAELEIGFDIVFAIGLVAVFPYLARPVLLAKQEGLPTVEIAHTATEISEIVDFGLRGSPGRILDQIWAVFAQLSARQPG